MLTSNVVKNYTHSSILIVSKSKAFIFIVIKMDNKWSYNDWSLNEGYHYYKQNEN